MKIKLLLLIIFLFTSAFPQTKGHLVIIGGGERTEPIMQKIVNLAGGTESKYIIIPNASSEPEETGKYHADEFRNLGCRNVEYLIADSLNVNDDKTLKKFDNVKCIFFSGGDQTRLTQYLLNSKMLEKINEIYQAGGVVSGTSAGAAVMSKIMITGDELLNKDSTVAFNTIIAGNIKHTEGFGFLQNEIIDQHFIKRKRNNRLLSLVLEYPEKLGIGIDESTAVIIYPDDILEVLGESQVLVFDASNSSKVKTNENNQLSASGVILSILVSGQKFDLNKRIVIQ
jgi:cyanophycinase